jgi:hypothetical protein
MSDCGCGCNPEVSPCQPGVPQQESVASQLTNLRAALLGPVAVTVTNGRGVWGEQCSPNSGGIPGYPRQSGEGWVCYIMRVLMAIVGIDVGFQVETTDATPTIIGSPANLLVPVGSVVLFHVEVVAKQDNGDNWATYVRNALLRNEGGTTTLLGISTVGTDLESDAAMNIDITPDDTNDAMQVEVIGLGATNLLWLMTVKKTEVNYTV